MIAGDHFTPNPQGNVAWNQADSECTGFDRTVATGNGFTGFYHRPVSDRFENLADCPDELLLFLHHVPYGHRLTSGKTVIQHVYDSHFDGAAAVGRIEAPIGRDPRDRKRFAVVADGKEAITRYRTLATGSTTVSEVALLGCELLTGRTHQIRVHLTRLGHPVVGDPTYGPRPKLAAALGLARPFLHAAALSFVHPVTGEDVALVEPLPDALVGALDRAGIARDDALPWSG
jgi:hypothetical protein